MAYPIPPDNRTVGSGNPPQDEDQLSDDAGVLAQAIALLAGTAGNPVPSGNVTNMAAVQAFLAAGYQGQPTIDGHLSSSVMPRPALYNAQHLRRWRRAYAQADQAIVPVVVCGDSIFYGIGADNTLTTVSATAQSAGFCGRLRGYFNNSPRTLMQAPGQGFLSAADLQVTPAGGANQANWEVTAIAKGLRLIGATQSLTFTVPAGITSVGVIQGNASAAFTNGHSGVADVTGLYNINGGGNIAMTALTGTNLPIVTNVAVAAGSTFQVVGPATAQTFISGFILNNAATAGVQVHRVSFGALVSGFLLGGQLSGALTMSPIPPVSFATTAAQANYKFAPGGPGVILVEYGYNDQQFQSGGGTGSQNGVTAALYQTWIQQFCTQAVADGWCVLLIAVGRNAGYTGTTLNAYFATLRAISNATDHVAFADVGELWGPYAASQADGFQMSGDEHPSPAGHGDMAAMVFEMLNGRAMAGITEVAPA